MNEFPLCSCHIPLLSSAVIDAPSQVDVRDVTDSTALITWLQPVAHVDGISMSYGPNKDSSDKKTIELSSMDTQYHLSELHPDTEYEVSLMARRGETTSFPIYETFTTGMTVNSFCKVQQIESKTSVCDVGALRRALKQLRSSRSCVKPLVYRKRVDIFQTWIPLSISRRWKRQMKALLWSG